ncbi:MAG: helix-turn-helix domain-containing protein, partial [Bradyrhizobium sp.]
MEFLTTSEAAEYLRLGERKLYELVTSGAIPCSKVTGKWLFPRHELDLWVLSGLARPAGMIAADPPPIVGGSQDDLLEWGLRASGSALASLNEGTMRGIERLQRGEVIATAIHFQGKELAADTNADANVAAVRAAPGLHDAVLLGVVRREQGLLVAPGNPTG